MDEQTNKDSVFIEMIIPSPVERVWEAWTESSLVKNWFGSDPRGHVLSAKLDVRPGGAFEVTFKDSDQTEHSCSGIYKEIELFKRLTFTWQWKSEPELESFVVLILTPDGSSTRMQFEHKNLGIGSQHDYIKGWQSTFVKLKQLLRENEQGTANNA